MWYIQQVLNQDEPQRPDLYGLAPWVPLLTVVAWGIVAVFVAAIIFWLTWFFGRPLRWVGKSTRLGWRRNLLGWTIPSAIVAVFWFAVLSWGSTYPWSNWSQFGGILTLGALFVFLLFPAANMLTFYALRNLGLNLRSLWSLISRRFLQRCPVHRSPHLGDRSPNRFFRTSIGDVIELCDDPDCQICRIAQGGELTPVTTNEVRANGLKHVRHAHSPAPTPEQQCLNTLTPHERKRWQQGRQALEEFEAFVADAEANNRIVVRVDQNYKQISKGVKAFVTIFTSTETYSGVDSMFFHWALRPGVAYQVESPGNGWGSHSQRYGVRYFGTQERAPKVYKSFNPKTLRRALEHFYQYPGPIS